MFFARDPLGRRSLLIHEYTPESPCLILTSVSTGIDPRYNFEELSTGYIYCLDFRSDTLEAVRYTTIPSSRAANLGAD
jgi:hypothetical protein